MRQNHLKLINRRDLDEFKQNIILIKSDSLKDKEDANSKCICVGVGDDPYAIIFPCAEIMRFYYCTSSTMANVLFDGRIHLPEQFLFDITDRKSFGPMDGHVFITLRKKMLDSDARLIASMYSLPEVVLKNAAEISLHATSSPKSSREIVAYPPFNGIENLEFNYVELIANGITRKLVTRIIKSHHRSNFATMEFDRENNYNYKTPGDEPEATCGGAIEAETDNPLEDQPAELDDGTFASPQFAAELRQEELEFRFPEMIKIPCLKIPPSSTDKDGHRKYLRKIETKFKAWTTAHSQGHFSKLREVIIKSTENFKLKALETSSIVSETGNSEYRRTIKLLRIAGQKNFAEVEYVKNILPFFAIVDDVYFNVYQAISVEYVRRQIFHLIDKDKKEARMVLVAKITANNRTRYLIDFQQSKPQELSYQVFWFDRDTASDDADKTLGRALIQFAKTKKSGDGAHINIDGLHWSWFKHKNPDKPITDNWIIDQVFQAKQK
jgi:hypothetical protein